MITPLYPCFFHALPPYSSSNPAFEEVVAASVQNFIYFHSLAAAPSVLALTYLDTIISYLIRCQKQNTAESVVMSLYGMN